MERWLGPRKKNLARFVAHCESCVQDVKTVVLVIKVCCCCLRERKIVLPHLYFYLIIVKSLQLRERRQIAELRKYCLLRVIIFLWHVFSLFFLFLTNCEFCVNFLQHGSQKVMSCNIS